MTPLHGIPLALVLAVLLPIRTCSTKMFQVYWNTTSPLFRVDKTNNVIDINRGNPPWEFDQFDMADMRIVWVKLHRISDWFWDDDFWLPPNVTWAKLKPTQENNYASFDDLFYYPIIFAVVLIFCRIFAEKKVFKPLGLRIGLKHKKRKPLPTNDVLEQEYISSSAKLDHDDIARLAKQLEMTERKIERWLRQRALLEKQGKLEKFSETGWRWIYYTSIFFYGMYSLWDKPWLWDIRNCWYNYPHHPVPNDIWWYYMLELSFYWGLCISQFFDVKRKDFWMMFIHHLATIALLSFSWTCNLHRIGTLVLLLHDCADILLELAKMLKYAGFKKTADVVFGLFSPCWIITRVGLFPTWIIYSCTVEAPQLVQYFPAYHVFNGLLSMLQILHVIWTYYLLKAIYFALFGSGSVEDVRSDVSSDDDPESD